MPHVSYPPGFDVAGEKDCDFESCVLFVDDQLTILLKHSGLIFPAASGIFSPDIPAGIHKAGDSIGPFKPINNDTEIVVYFGDFDNHRLYINTIKIRSKCS
jgi:hypothetical protein